MQCAGARPSRPVGHPSRPDSRAGRPKRHWGHKVLPHLRASSLSLPLLPRFCPLTALTHQAELSCLRAGDAPGCPRQWSGPDKSTLAVLRPAPAVVWRLHRSPLGRSGCVSAPSRDTDCGDSGEKGLPPAPPRAARTRLRLPPRPTRASTRPCASGEASGVGYGGTDPKACSSGPTPHPLPHPTPAPASWQCCHSVLSSDGADGSTGDCLAQRSKVSHGGVDPF